MSPMCPRACLGNVSPTVTIIWKPGLTQQTSGKICAEIGLTKDFAQTENKAESFAWGTSSPCSPSTPWFPVHTVQTKLYSLVTGWISITLADAKIVFLRSMKNCHHKSVLRCGMHKSSLRTLFNLNVEPMQLVSLTHPIERRSCVPDICPARRALNHYCFHCFIGALSSAQKINFPYLSDSDTKQSVPT